jgi:hypothetical protein
MLDLCATLSLEALIEPLEDHVPELVIPAWPTTEDKILRGMARVCCSKILL